MADDDTGDMRRVRDTCERLLLMKDERRRLYPSAAEVYYVNAVLTLSVQTELQ